MSPLARDLGWVGQYLRRLPNWKKLFDDSCLFVKSCNWEDLTRRLFLSVANREVLPEHGGPHNNVGSETRARRLELNRQAPLGNG